MVTFVFLHNIELVVQKSLKFFFGILTTTNIDIKLSLLANKDSTSSWMLSKIAYVNASNKFFFIIMTYHWLGTRFELCFSKIKMIIIILVTNLWIKKSLIFICKMFIFIGKIGLWLQPSWVWTWISIFCEFGRFILKVLF
jgi:hypothetical protein